MYFKVLLFIFALYFRFFLTIYCTAIVRQGCSGMLPIISVSRGHFTSTDILPARRDLDLVKNRSKLISLLANRSQVGSRRKTQHGKLFPNWSLDSNQKIDPPTKRGANGVTGKNPKNFKFWIQICGDPSSAIPWAGGVLTPAPPEISSFSCSSSSSSRRGRNTQENTPSSPFSYVPLRDSYPDQHNLWHFDAWVPSKASISPRLRDCDNL